MDQTTDNAQKGVLSRPGDRTKRAGDPFTSGDVELRTADDVIFQVHKVILSIASPVFEGMFSLPRPPSDDGHSEIKSEPVPLAEESDVVDFLLRLCYPVSPPRFVSFKLVEKTLCAAIKYEMEVAKTALEKILLSSCRNDPLETFAIACRLNIEEIAHAAAAVVRLSRKDWKDPSSPNDPWTSTIEHQCYIEDISSGCYHRLISCIRSGKMTPFCEKPRRFHKRLASVTFETMQLGEPDVLVLASGTEGFLTCSNLLEFASPQFADMIKNALIEDGFRIVMLSEDPGTVYCLLHLCTPMGEVNLPEMTVEDAYRVVAAAMRYDLRGASDFGRRRIMAYVNKNPLEVYFIAAQFKWEHEAEAAAILAIRLSATMDMSHPIVEDSPSKIYYSFLQFRHNYIATFSKVAAPASASLVKSWPMSKDIMRCWTDGSVSGFCPEVLFGWMMNHLCQPNLDCWTSAKKNHQVLLQVQKALSEVKLLL